jgi:hypothetical protein
MTQWESLIQELTLSELDKRLAALCLGIVGDVRYVSWLLAQMSSMEMGKEAGEAFCMLTGAHPTYDQLVAEKSRIDGEDDAHKDDFSDLASETDFGAGLEFLDESRARFWLQQKKGKLGEDVGHCFLGKPKSKRAYLDGLKSGDQWQRRNSAFALVSTYAANSLFDVAAPYNVQAAMLSTLE